MGQKITRRINRRTNRRGNAGRKILSSIGRDDLQLQVGTAAGDGADREADFALLFRVSHWIPAGTAGAVVILPRANGRAVFAAEGAGNSVSGLSFFGGPPRRKWTSRKRAGLEPWQQAATRGSFFTGPDAKLAPKAPVVGHC